MDFHVPMLPVQKEFFRATEYFVAIVSSRSCGKSWIAMFCALCDMMEGKNVLYMAQTDGAFYKGPWLHLQNFLRDFHLWDRWSWNGQYKIGTLDLGGGIKSRFNFGSYEVENSGRGATECSTLYLDEFMLSKPNILATMAPCLRGNDNYGNVIRPRIRAVGTPDMRSMWQLMVVEHEKHGIRLLRTKMSENVFMTDEQREVMSSVIFDDKLRRQEIEGEIILGEDATALISLKDFPTEVPYFSDDRVYAGLDMAHTGLRDGHVFGAIQGNRLLAFHEFGMASTLEVSGWIRRFNAAHKISSLDMDLAWSEAIYEQLRYEIPCRQIPFAAKPPEENEWREYANMRAYGYFRLAKMHRNGLCVDVEPSEWIDEGIVAEYKREIVNTHFQIDSQGRLLIEPKDDIRMRLGRSPDPADALMLAALERTEREDPEIVAVRTEQNRAKQRRYAGMMG